MRLNAQEQKFYDQLTTLENKYRKLKTVSGIDNKWEFLEGENAQAMTSMC